MNPQRVEEDLAAALAADPGRYDFDGDGVVGEPDLALLRRVIENELDDRRPGQEAEPTLARSPRTLEGRWELCGLLGRGGQAATYLARDTANGAWVAVKELDLGRLDDWKSIQLFEREAAALERLDHPGVPSYVAHFSVEHDGRVRFYLVQQFVPGHDLGEELALRGPLDEAAASRVRDAVFEILEYLHGHNPPIVHRDVKPSNLLRAPDGSIVLVDFGAVQSVQAKTIGGSTVVGTTGYMPMEQYMGRAVPASDLYALGSTLVHLMSGTNPAEMHVEDNRLQFEGRVKAGAPFMNGLHRVLEPAVEKRVQSVAEARQAFQTALVAPQKTETETAPRRGGFILVAIAALLVAGIGAYLYTESLKDPANFVHVENLYPTPPPGAKKVLFVGNSHTYWWDQPRIVAQMVPEGQPKLWFGVFAWPGVDVMWQVENGVGEAMREEAWDAVVLQPQSVEPAAAEQRFGAGMARFEKLVPERTRSIVWSPWARDPSSDIYDIYKQRWSGGSFDALSDRLEKSVRAWAQRSEICPLGEAWRRVRKEVPGAPLFDTKDGSKATYVGAYLNGLMLYSCIYRRDPAEVTFIVHGLSPESAAKVRTVASRVAHEQGVFQ